MMPSTATGGFVLIPRCQGKRLVGCSRCNPNPLAQPVVCSDCVDYIKEQTRPSSFILIEKGDHSNLKLGKLDLLKAINAACGCSKVIASNLTKPACCPNCAAVAKWARPSIPSRLLQLEMINGDDGADDGTDGVRIWVRAASYATKNYIRLISPQGVVQTLSGCSNSNKNDGHRSASCGSKNETEDWMGPWDMQQGDVLRFLALPEYFRSTGTAETTSLEFELCRISFGFATTSSLTASCSAVDSKTVGGGQTRADQDHKQRPAGSVLPGACNRYADALQALDETTAKYCSNATDDGCDNPVSSTPSQPSQLMESQLPVALSLADAEVDALCTQGEIIPLREEASIKQCLKPSLPTESDNRCIEVPSNDCRATAPVDTCDGVASPRPLAAASLAMATKEPIEADAGLREAPSDNGDGSATPETGINSSTRPHLQTDPELPATAASDSSTLRRDQQPIVPSDPSVKSAMPTTLQETTNTSPKPTESSCLPSPQCTEKKFVLFFVEKGSDMHKKTHIPGLRKLAEERGATVIDSFHKERRTTWPTHFVISQQVTAMESVATTLGFGDFDEMLDFVHEHGIVCATRTWAAPGNYDKSPYKEPTMMEQIFGFRRKHKRPTSNDGPGSPAKAARHTPNANVQASPRNLELSNLFHTLAKLHQSCPLFPGDDWKSYTFQMLSGRLRHLAFDVENDPDILNRLKNVPGFGESSMKIVKEFLETGQSTRVQEFETNPQRVAMKVMMNIWGVGRVRASELVNAGYTRIGTVRQAVTNGTLKLERNQYIGLKCYEDIMEEMERSEVEAIAKIVSDTVKNRFPSAELTIMGSYRRGKLTCGDADILITHPLYADKISSKILGVVVDELRASGHVAYHLTFISGMRHELFETIPANEANRLAEGSYGRSADKNDRSASSSSWMGVFNSPVIPGKRRRVDIKFYPYNERVYASLYFTGNGHFNRSMRLWATRKKNWTLSDHSLINKDSKRPVLINPTTEQQVFALLGLKWKEPSERDCFDAVEGVDGQLASQLPGDLTQKEVEADSKTHVWIK